MCLKTSQNKPLIAERDITCYKVLTKDLISPCYNKQYELGKKIISNLIEDNGEVTHGLHTYIRLDTAKNDTHYYWYDQTVRCGLIVDAPIVVECLIPRGANYYVSDSIEEYASNQLIPIKIVYDRCEDISN